MMKRLLLLLSASASTAIASNTDVAAESSFFGSWLFFGLLVIIIALAAAGVFFWWRKRGGVAATGKHKQQLGEIALNLLEESELTSLLALIGPKICSTLKLLGLHILAFDGVPFEREKPLEENTALLRERLGGKLRVLFYFRDSRLRERMGISNETVVSEKRYGDGEDKQLPEEILTSGAELLAPLELRRYTNSLGMPKLFTRLWKKVGLKIGELVLCPLIDKGTLHGYAVFFSKEAGQAEELYKTLTGYITQAVGSAEGNRKRRVALENLDNLYTQQREFNTIGTTILANTDLTRICQQITSAIAEHSPFTRAILSLVEGKKLRRFAFSNIPHEDVLRLLDQNPLTLEELENIRSDATQIGQCFYLADTFEVFDSHEITASTKNKSDFKNWNPSSILFVPLYGSFDELLGIITVDDPRSGRIPDEEDLQPLVSFTNLAAQAIATARLRQQLKRSQVEYRNLFFEATDALFVLDDEWRLITVNKKFIEITGYEEKEIVGQLLTMFTSKRGRTAVERSLQRIRSGYGRQELEFNLITADGTSLTVAMNIETKIAHQVGTMVETTLSQKGKMPTTTFLSVQGRYLGSLRNVTASKASEKELLRRQEQLKLINKLGRLALSSLDQQSLLSQVINALHEALGYDYVALFLLDKEYNELVLEAHCGILTGEVNPGFVVYLNEGIIGYSARTGSTRYVPHTAKDPNFIVHPGNTPIASELTIPLMVEGEVYGVLDLESTKEEAFDQSDIAALESIGDQIAQALHNIKLYEELREKAMALAWANEELVKLDRMKSDFVSMVSHELKTPVTVIKGYAQLLHDGIIGEVNERQKDVVGTIVDKTDELTNLISDLLNLLKLETDEFSLELKQVDVQAFLREFVTLQDKYIDTERLQLELEVPEKSIKLRGDEDKLRLVMANLLSNASKFTLGEGKVVITVSEESDGLRFSVVDQGIGVPEGEFEHIFDRLYQVDSTITRHYGGTGLGLAITRAVIHGHRGKIWVESELGVGSRFIFTIPNNL